MGALAFPWGTIEIHKVHRASQATKRSVEEALISGHGGFDFWSGRLCGSTSQASKS